MSPNKFWVINNSDPKEILGLKICLGLNRYFLSKKIFGSKKFLVENIFWSKNFLVEKNFWSKKYFGRKKYSTNTYLQTPTPQTHWRNIWTLPSAFYSQSSLIMFCWFGYKINIWLNEVSHLRDSWRIWRLLSITETWYFVNFEQPNL